MSETEYIAFLWRIITAEAVILTALVGVIWRHFLVDRSTRRELNRARADLDKCKAALGINGTPR